MKRKIIISTIVAILALITFQPSFTITNFNQTDELNKLADNYNDTCIIYEGYRSPKGKIETRASDTEIEEQMNEILSRLFPKQRVLDYPINGYYGVFKYGTCGAYQELIINMDCEDDDPITRTHGNIGESNADGNLQLKFCLVESSYFDYFSSDYGVLNVGSTFSGKTMLIVKFDTEDDDNRNSALINGVTVNDEIIGQCQVNHNYVVLSFIIFEKSNSFSPTFPSFSGIDRSYGVLGRLGSEQGYFVVDNEDDNNTSIVKINGYFRNILYDFAVVNNGPFGDLMIVDGNPVLFVSKVANCE